MAQKFEYFGKYILLEKLATGGMAEVFLARKTGADGIGKFCAIKRILPQFADSPEFIDMFRDEAKIAINLSHGNIVSIHEFGMERNQFFIVMDYVEGRNLRQILNKMKKGSSKFSVDQIVYVIKEVAAGLDHAHRCLDGSTGRPLNITHRDMSPQNIMVSFEGEIKIVDFGIAKAESQMETTRAGTLKGKFGYMSPEQAEGQPVDLRTDIFSLGTVLWELLANDRLFIANNEINTLRKIRDCQVPPLRKINPNIQAELDRIVQKALARDRNLRYQTAAALHRDLSRFLNRQYPDFSPHDFSVFIKTLFSDEILDTRKRIVEYANLPAAGQAGKSAASQEESDSTVVTSTLTSSFVSGSKIHEPTFSESEINFSNKTSFDNMEPPDESMPSLDLKSVSKNQKDLSGSTNTQATKIANIEAAKNHLDEKAIEKLSKQKIQISPKAPKTALDDDGSISNYTNYSINQYTQSRISPLPSKKRFNPMSFVILFALTLSLYGMSVKLFSGSMRPVISALDPFMHPIHEALGVIQETQMASRESESSPPPEPSLMDTSPPPLPNPALGKKVAYTHIVISSAPSGAEVYVNGKNTGLLTPGRVSVPADEKFSLELKRSGYIDYVMNDLTTEKVGLKYSATLQKALVGYLDIDVRPPRSARIYINGKPLQEKRLPITRYPVPANTQIKIHALYPQENMQAERVVTVRPDRRESVILQLRQNTRLPSNKK